MESNLSLANLSIVAMPSLSPAIACDSSVALRNVRVIEVNNPFRFDQRTVLDLAYLENESLGALAARAGFEVEHYDLSVNGDPVAAEAVWRCVAFPGCEVLLYTRAGGAGFVKAAGFALIAIALAVGWVAGPLDVFLAGIGLTMTASTIALVAGGLSLAGNMLISWARTLGQPSQPSWSSTYDPTGPKGLAQPGVPVPKGYGTMGWCGNIISSYVNYAGKDAYIYVLVCYGWGPAASISNLLINLKPISTYTQTNYFIRNGTNTQTPIDGFNKTVNGYPQETELLVANGPVVVPGTGTNVQGFDITIKLPSGLYHISGDGNTLPMNVCYRIEVAPHGTGAWVAPLFPRNPEPISTTHMDGSVTWPVWVLQPTDRFAGSGIVYAYDDGPHTAGDTATLTENVDVYDAVGHETTVTATFQGKWQLCDPNLGPQQVTGWYQGYRFLSVSNINPFYDTISVYGLVAGQWDVRVTKIGYQEPGQTFVDGDSTNSHLICDIWLWNINEIFFSDLAYPNMILVGVQALATSQLSGSDIQVMATITHNLGADTVLPAQLSSFEHDNPALVAYDVLTNPIYGMGVTAANIDVPAFVAWANFNDEAVTNQDGSSVRRHVFAGVFDQESDAWKTLQTIGNMSRAAVLQIGTRYSVVLDAPADPVQLFTVGNTKKDSFNETWLSLDDRCTLIECDFADSARTYRMDLPVSVMTLSDLNSGLAPKPTRTKLLGCTSRDQAWRWAYFQLISTKLSLRTVAFNAPIEAVCCQPGSLIGVQSDVTQWGMGGRIQPGSSTAVLMVERTDLTFATGVGWTVSVEHPVVPRGTATVASVAGLIITFTGSISGNRITKAVSPTGAESAVTGSGSNTITLSALSSLTAGQVVTLYDVNVVEQFLVSAVTVTPGVGSAITIEGGTFSAVPSVDSPWVYGMSLGFQPAKLFRVTQMKKSGDFQFQISAIEYNSLVYEDQIPNYGEIVGTPVVDASILNLSLNEVYQNGLLTGSATTAVVTAGWQPGNTTVGALIQLQTNGGTAQVVANIAKGDSWSFIGTIGVAYTVIVYGIDRDGNLGSTPATASLTVVASTNAPADVTGFTGYVASNTTFLSWAAATGAASYELRYASDAGSANWATATILWDGSALAYADPFIRTGLYMLKAITAPSAGSIESVNPATFQSKGASGGVDVPIASTVVIGQPFLYAGLLAFASPYGEATAKDGSVVTIPNQTIVFEGTPSESSFYFGYFYLDPSLNWNAVGSPSGSTATAGSTENIYYTGLPSTTASAAQAAQALALGTLAWYAEWYWTSGSGWGLSFANLISS